MTAENFSITNAPGSRPRGLSGSSAQGEPNAFSAKSNKTPPQRSNSAEKMSTETAEYTAYKALTDALAQVELAKRTLTQTQESEAVSYACLTTAHQKWLELSDLVDDCEETCERLRRHAETALAHAIHVAEHGKSA